jgi:hypothetical protein
MERIPWAKSVLDPTRTLGFSHTQNLNTQETLSLLFLLAKSIGLLRRRGHQVKDEKEGRGQRRNGIISIQVQSVAFDIFGLNPISSCLRVPNSAKP